MSRELILFYTPDRSKDDRLIQMLLMTMGFRFRMIQKEELGRQVGELAGLKEFSGQYGNDISGELKPEAKRASVPENSDEDKPDFAVSDEDQPEITDKFMILCGFSRNRLNDLLAGMRRNKVPPVPLKAMLTETNCQWTVRQLYRELKAEHEFMTAQKNNGE